MYNNDLKHEILDCIGWWGWVLILMYLTFVVLGIGVANKFVAHTDARFFISVGLLMLGLLYWTLEDSPIRWAFGLVQVIAALVSNWYQLRKYATVGFHESRYERLVFIILGIVAIAHGLKDMQKGYTNFQKWRNPTSQSSQSSAAPDPD